jgi:primosomal replication protein N
LNQLQLDALVLECQPLRYTPAGIPVLDMLLAHTSDVIEAGIARHVEMTLPALAVGDLARMMAGTALGTQLQLEGFLAPTRKGSSRVRLHVQHVRQAAAGSDPVYA